MNDNGMVMSLKQCFFFYNSRIKLNHNIYKFKMFART